MVGAGQVPAAPFAMNTARRMWVLFETIHDVTYFTPESRAATDALGCKGGWMGYFGMRAAPLGAAHPDQVRSAFFSFHDSLVRRALPDAWRIAEPRRYLRVRLDGVHGSLRRMLGETVHELAPVAELAAEAARLAPVAGRPMAAANAALELPDEPHLALWQACTVLRESRGDGHVAAQVTAELDPCAALVLFAAVTGLAPDYLRVARGWPESEWARSTERLTERGLLAGDGAPSAEGVERYRWVEERTDAAAAAVWHELGAARTERLADLLTPVAAELATHNDVMARNPMALDARALLVGTG